MSIIVLLFLFFAVLELSFIYPAKITSTHFLIPNIIFIIVLTQT